MSNTKPFISIITPTFNSATFIRETIESVRNQPYQNYEHIFIDGGSSDDTIHIIKKYNNDAIIISEPDEGISDAFNKGIKLARGAVIGIINSDDYYEDNILQDVANEYSGSNMNFILHGYLRQFSTTKNCIVKPRPFPNLTFYIDMPVYHPTVFVPKKIYEEIGAFDLSYDYSMDFDFLLRTWLKGYKFKQLKKVVAHFRLGGAANKNALKCHREVLHSQLINGLNPLVCKSTYLAKITVNYLKKTIIKNP